MEKREEMYHLKKVKKMVHLQAAVDLKLEDNPSLSLFFLITVLWPVHMNYSD